MEQQRSEFDNLLQSCDLYDTPFEQTQFESDVTAMKEQLTSCDKASIKPNVHAYTYTQVCSHD